MTCDGAARFASWSLAVLMLCAGPAKAQTEDDIDTSLSGTDSTTTDTSSTTTAGSSSSGTAGSTSVANGTVDGTTGTFTVKLLYAGGDADNHEQDYSEQASTTGYVIPINKASCDQGTIEVQLNGVNTAYLYLEPWYSTGSGQCNQGDRNTRVTSSQNCTKLSFAGDDSQGQISGRTRFNVVVNIGPVCAAGDGDKQLYFLALRSQNSSETTQSFGVLKFTVDTTGPTPATNLSSEPGETQIPLKWDAPADALTTSTAWIVVDPILAGEDQDSGVEDDAAVADDAGTDSDAGTTTDATDTSVQCPSSVLIANSTPDTSTLRDLEDQGELIIKRISPGSKESTTLDGRDFGLNVNLAAATVVIFDQAGNPSTMSNVVCVQVVDTTGFWDQYQANGGTAEPGCACSVPGARTGRFGFLAALPGLVLLGVCIARVRSRRRAR